MLKVKRMKRGCFYSKELGQVSLTELYKIVREENVDFLITDSNFDKDLLSMLWAVDTGYKNHTPRRSDFKNGDPKFLSRALRNGGMIEYIKKLEEKINEKNTSLL